MGKTAVVNRRRRKKTTRRRKKRRNPSTSYGAATRTQNRRKRRRRNLPAAGTRGAYSAGGYRRRPNPTFFNLDDLMEIAPAGTMGIWAARWAVKMAGPVEDEGPEFAHAVAILLASGIGSGIVGQILGDARKAEYAKIAALSWGGDLFARKRFFKDAEWVQENLYLDGGMGAFTDQSAIGQPEAYTDEMGNRWIYTSEGYVRAEDLVEGPNGEFYVMEGGMGANQLPSGGIKPDPATTGVGAFTDVSAIGRTRGRSSFGY